MARTSNILRYNEIFKRLKSHGPDTGFVLLYGEEDYLKKVAISRIEEFLKTKRIVFFGREVTFEDIQKAAVNTGLFVNKKLIVIYEFEKFKQKDDVLRMKIPQETYMILVISSDYEKRKIKDLLNKYVKLKNLTVYEFSPLDLKGFMIWVKSRLKRNHKEADDKIFETLIKRLPLNLTKADMELRKLFLYMGDDRYLDVHHLTILSHETEDPLQNALLNIMGYEKFHLNEVHRAISMKKSGEIFYETETHFARIIDARLGTFFSDRYRTDWRLRPYKRHKMLHTVKDASLVLKRLIGIEEASKTYIHDEKILKNLVILSLIP